MAATCTGVVHGDERLEPSRQLVRRPPCRHLSSDGARLRGQLAPSPDTGFQGGRTMFSHEVFKLNYSNRFRCLV